MNSSTRPTEATRIRRFDNASALNLALVEALATSVNALTSASRDPVLALPTGNTMIPFYEIAARMETKLQIPKWKCFNLDEYFPLNPSNESASFKAYMTQHFYSHLKVPPQLQEFLDGHQADREKECARFEAKIKSLGGVDIALLGIGTNGHIAFNEPGSPFDSRTRAIELHAQTLNANFKGEAPFTHALTMGIGTLLEAKKIYIVALGKNKAPAVRAAIKEIMSPRTPATALQAHADVTWFLDHEAAQLL